MSGCVRDLLVVVRIIAVMVVVGLPTTNYSEVLVIQLPIFSTCSLWLPPNSHRALYDYYYCLPLLLLLQGTYKYKLQLTSPWNLCV